MFLCVCFGFVCMCVSFSGLPKHLTPGEGQKRKKQLESLSLMQGHVPRGKGMK